MHDILSKLLKVQVLHDIPILYICRVTIELMKILEEENHDKSIST